jgi:hypothetical protein
MLCDQIASIQLHLAEVCVLLYGSRKGICTILQHYSLSCGFSPLGSLRTAMFVIVLEMCHLVSVEMNIYKWAVWKW